MHSVLREFGLELLPSDQGEVVQEARLNQLLEWTSLGDPYTMGERINEWLENIESEMENIRDCLEWARDNNRDRTVGTALGSFKLLLVSEGISSRGGQLVPDRRQRKRTAKPPPSRGLPGRGSSTDVTTKPSRANSVWR